MAKPIRSRTALVIAAVGAALAGALAAAGAAGAATGAAGAATGAGTTFYNWPMFGATPVHSNYSPETAISTANAASLASRWTATVGTPSYTSPAVAMITSLGKAVVYAGGNNHVYAYPAGGGAPIWTFKLASGVVETSPAVFGGTVYFGSTSGTIYAVNAATGALKCSFNTGQVVLASPVVVNAPDGSGPVVYDGTVPSSTSPGAEWAIYGPGNTHGACVKDWEFTGFVVSPGGSWSPPAYGTDAEGVRLLVFGSKDTDDSVYALNATTGALVWRYRTATVQYSDVGAPPAISVPGRNGFADGVVYVTGKDKVVYALDLTTGALIWKHGLAAGTNSSKGDLSGAALLGNRVYVGSDSGVYALSATTGGLVWHVLSQSTFYATPSVTGPSGQQVLLIGSNGGGLYALSLASGATVWTQKPASGFWASAAISQGAFYVEGLDGVLRSYAPAP
jgi:outer membrane protein assembly factor BamB